MLTQTAVEPKELSIATKRLWPEHASQCRVRSANHKSLDKERKEFDTMTRITYKVL
jgi:hypothetical protein